MHLIVLLSNICVVVLYMHMHVLSTLSCMSTFAVLCGTNGEACWAKYGSYPIHRGYCHEQGLRILLSCIEANANRYGVIGQRMANMMVKMVVKMMVTHVHPCLCWSSSRSVQAQAVHRAAAVTEHRFLCARLCSGVCVAQRRQGIVHQAELHLPEPGLRII